MAQARRLAAEDRQGSSMSEFMMALRQGRRIDASDLIGAPNLSPAAFLALSRAQLAIGDSMSAHETLQQGVEWAPTSRILHLALHQLTAKSA